MYELADPRRRDLLKKLALGGAAWFTPGLFAEALKETAAMTEGPFYPDKMPLDTDNDLLVINDSISPSVGDITYLSGRVLTSTGQPMRNAFVEIWQCDAKGSYLHTRGRTEKIDNNFQGYGRFMTDSTGKYFFRTIKPVPYSTGGVSRCPHIHLAVCQSGKRILTTQILIRGHETNPADGEFKRIKDASLRETVLADFKPVQGSKMNEYTASFDVILGKTLSEDESGKLGGVGKSVLSSRRPGA